MVEKKITPYGSWESPITAEMVATQGETRLYDFQVDGEDLYWIERRPREGGRHVIVNLTPEGEIQDVNPAPYNARTRVHEYGGGALSVYQGTVYFSNYADQRIYRQTIGEEPVALTAEGPWRYADGVVDGRRLRLHCVTEDHSQQEENEPENKLVSIDLVTGEVVQILTHGNDFYAAPRLSPDGKRLAWLTWNHPDMPWDGTELHVAEFQEDGSLGTAQKVAGGREESIFQPEWSPDGTLYLVSDRTGWWNIYRWQGDEIEPLFLLDADIGRPHWLFSYRTFAFESPDRLTCIYARQGIWYLGKMDLQTRQFQEIDLPYTYMAFLVALPSKAIMEAASGLEASSVVSVNLDSGEHMVMRRTVEISVNEANFSEPQPITFPTAGGKIAYANYYPPHNVFYRAPDSEKPPLVVRSHGGPTSAEEAKLDLEIQYWTTRGIAYLDVNYRGSAWYGREYRQALRGQWGVVDLEDCIHGAKYLVAKGEVDGKRMAITGGSAGGYTTLCALTFSDLFQAGASRYGVSDISALAMETHKFESHYMDSMVGPYPEASELYEARSPIHHIEKMNTPVLFLQGLEDVIVPPNQAQRMVSALEEKGIPVAYLTFEGEQHGFRQAKNIIRVLQAELYFFGRILGFVPAENIEPIEIKNL